MERVKLFLKGVCMGVADIIPGVSGGTLALILGIYAELVNTIKGLHLRWLPSVWRWVRSGFDADKAKVVLDEWRAMNVPFLMILGAGIALAIAAGGMIIPDLLDNHPEVMRALFFGLIVASVGIPLRMVVFRTKATWSVVIGAAVVGVAIGWVATDPDRMYEVGVTWAEVEAQEGDTLKEIGRRGPSAWPANQVYWADENAPLRDVLESEMAQLGLNADQAQVKPGSEEAERFKETYEELEIPPGTKVYVPQPAPWYIFVVGFIAICAMILPGISGSYLLLIFGAYYFVLNALRAVISGMTEMTIPMTAAFFVGLFMIGAAMGLLTFARVMSFLLRRYPAPTLGLLVGLMVGCLRGIWPFREIVDGQVTNVMPQTFSTTEMAVLAAGIGGAVVVTILSRLGRRRSGDGAADAA